MDLVGKYFSPRPSPIVKRLEFNSRRQKEGESIATYVAELRKIAEHCDFGAVLSDMLRLRDRLCGTVHKGIQRRLLVEAALTFDKARIERANVVTEEPVKDEEPGEEYTLFQIQAGPSIKVNGKPVAMEIDTGASVTVVGEDTFKTIQAGDSSLELRRTTVRLRTYTGETIPVQGSALVPQWPVPNSAPHCDKWGGNTSPGPGLALQLDWRTIFSVGTMLSLQQVLDKHSEGLGELRDVTAKIYIDKDERPRFFPARPVSFAMRKKVEEELQRLQSMGVIQPVQFSDWAAPIVPVMKNDCRVRICGDYKITVKVEKYPFPRIEELFSSLAGGKSFSKLDLSHAYLQVQLDEETSLLGGVSTSYLPAGNGNPAAGNQWYVCLHRRHPRYWFVRERTSQQLGAGAREVGVGGDAVEKGEMCLSPPISLIPGSHYL